ncbi:hypothetical protein [Gracilimonas sp.]|uniref:hypothetical protein n=1 Tax=Gracilimonas sp. TaxID=1974203 RepID=UPI0028722426|nr:hypothetical protein [Gracilimonas sp.]
MITEKTEYYPEPSKNGNINLKRVDVVLKDGEELSRKNHRQVLTPNQDVSKFPQDVQDVCNSWWKHHSGKDPTAEEIEEQKRNRMVLEAGDFHASINLLSFDRGEIKEVYDEQGNEAGLTPISNAIDSAISQLPKRNQVKYTKLLEKRTQFRRTNKEVIQIATTIGMNETQLDEFFEQAKKLSV